LDAALCEEAILRVADIQSGDCLDFSYVDGLITLTKIDAGETHCASHR
jgi:hypothetical protein